MGVAGGVGGGAAESSRPREQPDASGPADSQRLVLRRTFAGVFDFERRRALAQGPVKMRGISRGLLFLLLLLASSAVSWAG